MGKQKDDQPSGIRGPGGPPPPPARTTPSAKASKKSAAEVTPARASLERRSYPLLRTLQRVPRWVIIILPAVLLFLGLIQTGNLSWLGGVLLLLVAFFLGWLLVLSWPVVSPGSRALRVVVLVALVGIAVMKFLGRI